MLISHLLQSRSLGQAQAQHLGRIPGVRLHVVAPERWRDETGRWRAVEPPDDRSFVWEVGKIALPWAGPAKHHLHWYPGLGRILRDFQPHVIDLWEEPGGLSTAQACWLRNRHAPAAKIVLETVQNRSRRLPLPFQYLQSYALSNTDFLIARNAAALQLARVHGYGGSAEVIEGAIDAELFRPLDRPLCRRQLGLKGFVVGFAANLVEGIGAECLIESLPACPDRVNVLVCGAGPSVPDLLRRTSALGVGDRVRFIPGESVEDRIIFLNAIDALALPSCTVAHCPDYFEHVMLQALACRTPVLAPSIDEIPKALDRCGICFLDANPRSLADAITQLLDNPEQRERLAEAGFNKVQAFHTWEQIARRVRKIYETLAPSLT